MFPVAVLGLAFYVFMAVATSPLAWRSRRREVALVRLASVIVGVGFVLYLIYVELFQVGSICLWCTGVHVATFLLFGLLAMTAAVWGLDPAKSSARTVAAGVTRPGRSCRRGSAALIRARNAL